MIVHSLRYYYYGICSSTRESGHIVRENVRRAHNPVYLVLVLELVLSHRGKGLLGTRKRILIAHPSIILRCVIMQNIWLTISAEEWALPPACISHVDEAFDQYSEI